MLFTDGYEGTMIYESLMFQPSLRTSNMTLQCALLMNSSSSIGCRARYVSRNGLDLPAARLKAGPPAAIYQQARWR